MENPLNPLEHQEPLENQNPLDDPLLDALERSIENPLELRDYIWGPKPSQLHGEYFVTQHGIANPYQHPWRGNLVVLVDRYTGSAAVWMATIIKDNKLGITAGEETGGRASFFGDVAPIYLPNSGLSCLIPSSYFERPAGYDDRRGVLPDLSLDVTLDDNILIEKIYNYIENKN